MFFALSNLSSQEVRRIENPWSEPPAPEELLKADKTDFTEWSVKPTTKHCFFNMAEGMDPLRRVSEKYDNRVVALHGFVADIDREIPDQHFDVEYLMKRSRTEYLPNYASRTHSGNGRLVWIFKTPVGVPNQEAATAFLTFFANELKIKSFWGPLDPASYKPYQYYERGREWKSVSNDTISDEMLQYWLFKSTAEINFATDDRDTRIPWDKINERFQELHPGKWPGKIEEGARGPAFWRDTRSGNSAVIRRGGIQDFGGEFKPWSSLLGYEWVERLQGERVGSVIKSFWTDEKSYYHFDPENPAPVMVFNETKLARKLRVERNFSTAQPEGRYYSELDEVIKKIDERVVSAVGPFVHFRPGPLLVGGKLYLNSSMVRPMNPAPEPEEYKGQPIPFGYKFPYTASILKHMFPKDSSKRYPLEYILAFLRYKYVNALAYKPKRSQALVLMGPANSGKTLFNEGIVAPILGDPRVNNSMISVSEDRQIGRSIVGQPFAFAVGRTNHNDGLAEYPVWAYDDERVRNDKEQGDYTNFVKQTTSLGTVRFNPKHVKELYTIWRGAQLINCNEDGQSSQQLPNIDTSVLDKIMLFRVNGGFDFLPDDVATETLRKELPYLCRWLLNWEIPAHCVGKARFGLEPYHDPHLLRLAYENGANYEFSEMLGLFLHNFREMKKANGEDVEYWVGTSSQLVTELTTWNSAAGRTYTPRSIGRSLSDLINRGLNIRVDRSSKTRMYYIPVNLSAEPDHREEEIVPLSSEEIDNLQIFKGS